MLLVFVSVLVALVGGGSGLAAAQSPSYDPDSPAGQQYAIPVDAARSTGAAAGSAGKATSSSPTRTRDAGSSSTEATGDGPALFGEGVSREQETSGAAGKPSDAKEKPSDARAGRSTPSAAPSFEASGSSGSGTLIGLATGLVVLVAGAALASAMTVRRRRVARQ